MTKTKWLKLLKVIIPVYTETHTKAMNTKCKVTGIQMGGAAWPKGGGRTVGINM
jgi:hypothetical protein